MKLNKNIEYELEKYINKLYYEIEALVYSDEIGETKENVFTEYIMQTLADAGETEGIRLCPFVKENKSENIQFKINGYAIEEGYESIDIFITYYRDINEYYNINKAEFDKLIKWPTAFINAAMKGHLDDIEQSTEAYGLASLLSKEYKKIIRVNFFIISNGNIAYDPPKENKLKNFDDLLLNYNIWDIERLHRLYQSKNNREPIEINFDNISDQDIPCLKMPSNNELYECYLAIVPGSILYTLYRNYGTRLLESNVRAFLQQTGKVNKGMRQTIIYDPTMFLPYNNGLATTAQEVKVQLNKDGQPVITYVKDFQIVNGGQTTASIFHTKKNYKADISNIYVQMKLTVIKDEDKKTEIVPFISRYANSQNKVSELDLSSNNKFLQRLEELSRTTYAIDQRDRNIQTIWYFERVKGQYREALNKEPTKSKKEAFKVKYPKKQIIIKSEVAKYMNLWNLKPYLVSKGSQKNYIEFIKDVDILFRKQQPSKLYWEDLVAHAILFKVVDKLFGRKNNNPIGDTNIKSLTVNYTISYFHYLTKNNLNLGLIWEKQTIDGELLPELKKLLIYIYKYFISLDVALISEAAKKESTWKSLLLHNYNLDEQIINKYLISDSDKKLRYNSDIDDVEETKKYQNLNEILDLGVTFWDGLNKYLLKNDCLSLTKKNYVTAIRNKIKLQKDLSEIQIKKGGEIINLLKDQSFNFEDICKLSTIKESKKIDTEKVYTRIKALNKKDWDRIIDLGNQTGVINFKQEAIIRTVIEKTNKKEIISLNRLIVVNDILDKLKKFKLKK